MARLKPYINNEGIYRTLILKVSFLILYFIITIHGALAQKYFKNAIPFQYVTRLILSDSTYVVAEYTDKKYKEPLTTRIYYHWIAKDKIIQAQGTYFGKLLHGEYRVFFSNGQPKTEGSFYMGKKTKRWKHWDQNGTLRKVSRWKNGMEHGRFTIYDENGNLVQTGRMRRGKLYQGNFLLKTITKLKHWKVHRDQNDADENTQEDNNEGF